MSNLKEKKEKKIISTEDEKNKKNIEKQENKILENLKENNDSIKKSEENTGIIKNAQENTEVIEKNNAIIEEENNTDDLLENSEINKNEEEAATILSDCENIEEAKKEEKAKKDGLHKYTIAIAITSAVLLIALVVFSIVFALINRTNNKIVNGIFVKGIDVSGLTVEKASEKLNNIFNEKLKQSITLKHNDYETSISPEQIESSFGIEEAMNMAYSVGRSGKILKDNYSIINAALAKIEITPSFTYNEKALEDFINSTSENLPDTVKQSEYSIDGNKLIINKGEKGYIIKQDELKNNIVNYMSDIKQENIQIEIPVEIKEPNTVDINEIHNQIYKEAKDAYYTKDPFTVYPHVNGVDFAISMEEAQNLVNTDETQITIPLKITTPNVTTNRIGTEAFPDLIATYSTTFATSNANRTTNIKLASQKINGVVLMPGEQFSYNKVVGKRTAAAGYKTAAVYVGGKVEQGIGGGICQVSSTLYNTALRANLEIVKRSNHRFATGYVPLSTDATVSWGGPEFVFKNSRKYPVKIVSTVSGGRIKIDIYGCKEQVEYDVEIKSETLQVIPMQTEYRTNTSLTPGTKKTVQKGHKGYKSRAYRILKLNGSVVSKQLLSTDTYAQLSTIIEQN